MFWGKRMMRFHLLANRDDGFQKWLRTAAGLGQIAKLNGHLLPLQKRTDGRRHLPTQSVRKVASSEGVPGLRKNVNLDEAQEGAVQRCTFDGKLMCPFR